MELQLQVMEEELLEFPKVRFDQFNTSHSDTPAGKVVAGIDNHTEHRNSLQNSSRSHVEGVVQIHTPILKLKNHTINNQESRNRKIDD